MKFEILFTEDASDQFQYLERAKDKKTVFKAVQKALAFMEVNIKHPSLNTHEYNGLVGPKNEKIFESYAQNNTPGAYRIFWYYGPGKNFITILDISPHP